jgi:hypothetical protein
MKKQPARKRAPGGGRKRLYAAGTVPVSFRLPIEIVSLLDGLGPNRQAALIGIVRTSHQYRMEFGSTNGSIPADITASQGSIVEAVAYPYNASAVVACTHHQSDG